MVVLDTSVLAYAVGGDHPLRRPCAALLDAVGEGAVDASTTAEVIQEFVHVRSRRRPRSDAVSQGTRYLELLAPLIAVDDGVVAEGLRLYQRHPRLGSFDAFLAAAAITAGADALVSTDVAFAGVPGLNHVDPRAGVEALLG